MKISLFFTDGYDWQIKTNRYAFPFFWSKIKPTLVVEYPDFKHWLVPIISKESRNLTIYRMRKFLPFSRKIFLLEKINLFLNLVILKLFITPFILKKPIGEIWFFYPQIFELSNWFFSKKKTKFIYHVVDELSEYRFWYKTVKRRKVFKKIEKKAILKTDIVFTTSKVLFDKSKLLNSNTYCLGNGAFTKELISLAEKTKTNHQIRRFNKPIVGFVGGIDSYRFDSKLLSLLAQKYKNYSFIIIGPEGDSVELPKAKNIFYLGFQSRKMIAFYLKEFDAALMLYPKNRYAKAVQPVKLFDYFALGLPVVTKNLPYINDYKDFLYAANSNDEYINLLEKAIREKSSKKAKVRIQIAKKHDWTNLTKKAYNFVRGNLN